IGFAKMHCSFNDSVQNRVQIVRRPTYHTQDIADGSLVFERLLQLTRALLRHLEQTRVLDGDDRLVGKGLQQFDMRVGKWLGFGTTKAYCSNSHALIK